MRVLKSDSSLSHSVIFLTLSFIFLLAIQALSINQFMLSKEFLTLGLKSNYLTILFGLLTVYLVFNFKPKSQWFFLIFVVVVVLKSFLFLSSSFNKLILVLNFIYVIFAFYYFTTWEMFNLSAKHNPNFSKNDLEKRTRFEIGGQIFKENKLYSEFLLTNIDQYGCFALLAEGNSEKLDLGVELEIRVTLEGTIFKSSGICAATYDNGIGIAFNNESNGLRSLSGLYQVCLERGIV